METGPWILIVDDDTAFSALLTELLTSAGYSTYEAHTCEEATEAVTHSTPALAIVDYQLTDTNGVSWMTTTREAGHKFPMVLLSGTWHDVSSFHKLRNILQISLILQKPIDPEFFLEQIRDHLPEPAATIPQDFRVLENQMAGTSVEWTPYNRPQLRHPGQLEQALNAVRINFARELPERVKNLVKVVKQIKDNPESREFHSPAINEAHRLSGSAGSFGFHAVGQAAAKVTQLLTNLEVGSTTMAEIVWSELMRALTALETAANHAASSSTVGQPPPSMRSERRKIAVLSDASTFTRLRDSVPDIEFLCAETPGELMDFAKEKFLQALILDFSICPMSSALEITRAFRVMPERENIEIIVIGDENHLYSSSEILFLGASAVLEKPLTNKACEAISKLMPPIEFRLLVVDDDPDITDFITLLLSQRGIEVQALNDPSKILTRLQTYKPDAILLDVVMPGLSGYDVCKMLRAHQDWATVPIVFLTSKTDPEARRLAFKSGATDFLTKPIVSEELAARINAKLLRPDGISPSSNFVDRPVLEKLLQEALLSAQRKAEPLTVSLVQLKEIDSISGPRRLFVVDLATEKIRRTSSARFRIGDIRGQLADLFVFVFPGARTEEADGALSLLAKEINNLKLATDGNEFYSPTVAFGSAELFRDTDEGADLLGIAFGRLAD